VVTSPVEVQRRADPGPIPEPPTGFAGRLRLRVFGIDDDEAGFEANGFTAADDATREQLEEVGRWFARGFRAALAEPDAGRLGPYLEAVGPEYRGFAYEGAAVAFTVLDFLAPPARRMRALVSGTGIAHSWLLPIGYGWGRSELKLMPRRPPKSFDPLTGWGALDGAGFHHGFYKPQRFLDEARPQRGLSGPAARVFDQGLGRALWFYRGGDPERIAATIHAFPRARRGDVWGGMASAATYAGGVGADVLESLRESAGECAPDLAVGAVLAAKARVLGGNVVPHTELACSVLFGGTPREASNLVEAAVEGLPMIGRESAYEAARDRMREAIASR
jgi:hypothetical protein